MAATAAPGPAAGDVSTSLPLPVRKRLPLANRWDVVPLVGTVIGAIRVIYGIFQLILDLFLTCCRCNLGLSQKGVKHIERGSVALFSFLPAVRQYLREENARLSKPDEPHKPVDKTGAGGNGVAHATGKSGGVRGAVGNTLPPDHTFD